MSAVIAETTALTSGNRAPCDTVSETFLNDATNKVKVINNDAQINALADDKEGKGMELASSELVVMINDSQSSSSLRSRSAKNGGEEDANNEMEIDTSETTSREHTAPTTRRASTTSRFKEKRPEPLKLNSNLNQDIPLDLSVKSAGNVPSGALGSIFNLGQLNQMAPLETPRIQWQDNDSLLASTKSRLFSSSTNASHRARISSIMGESPPITPSTPLMDVMFSSTAAASIHRLPSDSSYSAILALESPLHSFLTSPFDLDKLHILDRLSQPSKQDHYHHHHHNQPRTDARGVPRRSCSTDSLNILTNNCRSQTIAADNISPNRIKTRCDGGHSPNSLGVNSKKNSISPLATKSFSNKSGGGLNSPTKFLYTNQQIATNNESHHQHQSPTANSNGKSLTPTSVATVNLFNIHLSSPNGSSRQSPVDQTLGLTKTNSQQQYKSPSFPSLDQETSLLDVQNSLLYSQHNARTPLLGFSSSSNGLDQNNNPLLGDHYHRQHSNPSISSTATLNTPTLISPSQMKANQLCLLPSPTLSPMPSVFDIPSPFLMFAPTSTQASLQQNGSPSSLSPVSSENKLHMNKQLAGQNLRGDANKKTRCEEKQADKSSTQATVHLRPEKYLIQSSKSLPSNSGGVQDEDMLKCQSNPVTAQHGELNLVKNDLSQLITPAEEKTATRLGPKMGDAHEDDDLQQDIDMAIDDDNGHTTSSADIPTKSYNFENSTRPSTVIPHICISYHTHAKSLSNLRDNQSKSNKFASQTGAVSDSNCLGLVDCNQTSDEFDRPREQRHLLGNRSLSPRAFHARVKNYHNERLESSSAPPNVHQRRRRSKIKNVADSFSEMTDNKSDKDKVSRPMIGFDNRAPNLSQSASSLNQAHSNRASNRPYPEMRSRLTTSSLRFDGQSDVIGENSFLNGRSSSAEPAIYSANHPNKIVPCTTANGNSANFSPSQSASHLCSGQTSSNLSGQSQQQAHNLRGPSHNQNLDGHRFQSTNQPNQQQPHHHHHQQQYHSLANHQFQYNIHANNYDHHNNQHQPYNAQQLYSMSAGELQRLQYSRPSCPTQQPSLATGVVFNKADSIVLPQRISSYQQQYNIQQQQHHHHQHQHQHHQQNLQHQQHSSFPHSLQNLPGITTGSISNSQTGAHHRVQCESQFLNQAPSSAQSQSQTLINQVGFQPTAAQVLCGKFESSNQLNYCQDVMARGDTLESSLSKEHASLLMCAKSPTSQQKSSGLINQYIVDIESRSESRSSSSLDFTNSFAGSNGSRSNSAASSNLAAKKYHCDQCSKSFTRSDMLTRHRRLHSGDRPFQCTECKQEFSRSDHLSTHMRTHTGEKPYKCKLCTYSACRKDMITRHLKVHNRSPNLDE